MTRKLDSAALDDVGVTLGLAGQSAGEAILEDNRVQQSLNTNEFSRRGLTLGQSEGIFQGVLRNIHPLGGEVIFSTCTPYQQTVGSILPWPVPVPRGLDVWLLQASVLNITGGGVLTGGLFLNYDARSQAFGINNSGAAVVASTQFAVMWWETAKAQTFRFGVANETYPDLKPIRLQRGFNPGTSITFSSTGSVASTWDCNLLLGLFPRGLGQDVIG